MIRRVLARILGRGTSSPRRASPSPQPTFEQAIEIHQQGNLPEAEEIYRALLKTQPERPDVLHLLGMLQAQRGNLAAALELIGRAIEIDPDNAVAHSNLGNVFRALKQPQQALSSYDRAIAISPENVEALNNRGVLLGDLRRYEEAVTSYDRALAVNPEYAEAFSNRGAALRGLIQYEDSLASYDRALILNPDYVEALCGRGIALGNLGRYEESLASYDRALALRPEFVDVFYNRGDAFRALERHGEALASYDRALALSPDHSGALINRGASLIDLNRYEEALASCDRALTLTPDNADALTNRGTALRHLKRYEDALVSYDSALAIAPDRPVISLNRGFLLHELQRFAEAEVAFRQALTLDPELDLAHYNLALLRLSQKRFKEGWEGYEWRWKTKDFNSSPRQFPQEKWQGEATATETLLVWQEQGVGDIILYAGMIPDLVAQGVCLIVECEQRFEPLLARSFPQARVVVRSDPAHIMTLEARWQCPLASLGRWLRPRVEDFRWRGPYLIPDATRAAAFRRRYRELGEGPVIGISWRSSNEKMGERKSMSLLDWAPLLALPGATFVNLQYGDCEEALSSLKRHTSISVYHDNTVNSLKDLDGFAAQVAAMDLVISTSNSTVHFAGALGIPVWTLLPRSGGGLLWYWFNEGVNSLWYPSMRLFRQDISGDWSDMFARVTEALREFLMKSR